jgi:histidine triad (HIT) family protein
VPAQAGCIFCTIAQRHAQGDPGSRVLYDDPLVYVIRDIRPAAVQHLLVIPKAHVANVNSLTGADVGLGE